MNRQIAKYGNDKKWLIESEDKHYFFCNTLNEEPEYVYTPHNNLLETSSFVLAERILKELEKGCLNFTESKSIISWHSTMLDDFCEKDGNEIIELFDKHFFSKADWTYGIIPEEIFGNKDERDLLIYEWLANCTTMQLAAVFKFANIFQSLNLAYVLAILQEEYRCDLKELKVQFRLIARYIKEYVFITTFDDIIELFDLFSFYYGIHLVEYGNIIYKIENFGEDVEQENVQIDNGNDEVCCITENNQERHILDFPEWLIQENFSEEECKKYYLILRSIDSQAIRIRKSASNLLTSNSAEECLSVVKDLYQSVEFITANKEQFELYDFILTLFLKYKGMNNPENEIRKFCSHDSINLCKDNPTEHNEILEETENEEIDDCDVEEEKDFEKIFKEWLVQEGFTLQIIKNYFDVLRKIDNHAIQIRKSHTNFLGATSVKECLEIAKDLYNSEVFVSLIENNNYVYDEVIALFLKCIQCPLKEKELHHLVLTEEKYMAIKANLLHNYKCGIQEASNLQTPEKDIGEEEKEDIYVNLIGSKVTNDLLALRNYYHYTDGECDKEQPYVIDLGEVAHFDLKRNDEKRNDIIVSIGKNYSDFSLKCWAKKISVLEGNEHICYQIIIYVKNDLIQDILVVKDRVVFYEKENFSFIGLENPIKHCYMIVDSNQLPLKIKRELKYLSKKICLSVVHFNIKGSPHLPRVLSSGRKFFNSKFSFRLQSGYREVYMEMEVFCSGNIITGFNYATYATNKQIENSHLVENNYREFIDMLLAFSDLYEESIF